jgi:hypothetical protein
VNQPTLQILMRFYNLPHHRHRQYQFHHHHHQQLLGTQLKSVMEQQELRNLTQQKRQKHRLHL